MIEDGAASSTAEDEPLVCYRGMVERYHRTLDLMSDRGLAELDEKLADAEAYARCVAEHAPTAAVLDVGSGVGLPGVVVATRMAPRRVVLVERRRRRVAFLRMVAARCGVGNVVVVGDDVRMVVPESIGGPVGAITAQAVAGLPDLYRLTRHLHDEQVVLVARRGPSWADEVSALTDGLGCAVEVVTAEALGRGGTLVVLVAAGGRVCR